MTSIGIDLGTTNSCVAVYRNGRVEIIANDAGFRVTPSCVSFNETERIIGEVAKEEASLNCKNTLFQIKRLIGRKYNDPNVQQDIKMWGFDVVEEGGKPYVQVTYKERMINFSPEQISAMILQQLKDDAEAYMGEKITDAVITVPAYFNDAQRTATRDAGRIAGLNVLSMINEPTAAAIAYGLDSKNNGIRNVLIFDLGGGTFDVTIVTIEDQIFDVKATGGDTHLGGEDITNRMVKYFVEEFQQKHGVDISDSRRALSRLNVACEHAKKKLSVANSAKVQIDGLYMALDFKSNISRAKFEDMNLDLFESTLASVKSVLADANMKKEEIDDIVLVGGSTRIPKIRELLKKFFDGKEMCRIINPDEAVAHGAAALAENIKSGKDRTMKSLQLRDVIPISIGNEIEREQMCIVVARNTTIPTKISKNFYTSEDKQTSIRFSIYEGERVRVHDNHHLGTFVLSGIKSAPAGEAEVEVVFEIDRSGILTVTARDVETGNVKDIKITNEERQMEEIEIKKMIAEAEKFRAEDREWKERIAAKNELEELVFKVKQSVINDEFSIKPDDKRKIMEISNEAANWIKTNNVGKLDASSIRQRREEINEIFNLLREISTG